MEYQKLKNSRAQSKVKSIGKILQSNENRKITISFEYFQKGSPVGNPQNFESWEKDSLLAKLISRLAEMTCNNYPKSVSLGHFESYGRYPEDPDTGFEKPSFANEFSTWTKIRLGAKIRAIGFFQDTTFQLVFLDKAHKFCTSAPRNQKKKHQKIK